MNNNMVLAFPQFQQFLADALEIDQDVLAPQASFLNDISVESLKLVEIILRMENELAVAIPTEAAWEIRTVEDMYNFYRQQVGEDPVVL